MITVAKTIAHKLNKAKGPVKFLIPSEGWSSMSREGESLYEPETDKIFIEELKSQLKSEIEVREIDAHLEDPEFAHAIASALAQMVENQIESSTAHNLT
jgi:uncharacterized protein (UPF0261 family)